MICTGTFPSRLKFSEIQPLLKKGDQKKKMSKYRHNSMKYFSKWEPVKRSNLQESLLFLLYINDLPKIISDISKTILFADGTSIITTNSGLSEFKRNINNVFIKINNWLKSNLLSIILIKPIFCSS